MAASDQIIFHCRDLQSHYRRMPDCSSECSERSADGNNNDIDDGNDDDGNDDDGNDDGNGDGNGDDDGDNDSDENDNCSKKNYSIPLQFNQSFGRIRVGRRSKINRFCIPG